VAQLWCDGFDHYGSGSTGRTNMLSGAWAEVAATAQPNTPSWGARTGTYALRGGTTSEGTYARRSLGSDLATVIASFGYSLDMLPVGSDICMCALQSSLGNELASLRPTSDGRLRLYTYDVSNELLLVSTTAGPVFVAETWHEIEVKFALGSGTCTVQVDGTTVLTASGITWKARTEGTVTTAAQFLFGGRVTTGDAAQQWYDDVILRDTSGSRNNDLEGFALRVAYLGPISDDTTQGWTAHPRKKIGTGILDLTTADTSSTAAVSAADATALRLGAAEYTIEGFVRFRTLPTASNKAVLFGKWQETGDKREWQLYLGGPDLDAGYVTFRISTDGTSGTVTNVHSWPWSPDTDTWYHVAVVRTGTDNLLFIDGVQQGPPVADSATYFGGAATQVLGAEMSDATTVVSGTHFDGFMDEVRITNGFARYTSDFTPTTVAFGRNSTDDTHFSTVALLAGFDSGVVDESSYARTLTPRNAAAKFTVDDGDFNYQTIDQATPRDDTFIEADLLTAGNVYQLDDVPSADETVTLGATTYTFKGSVGTTANEVLIGATVADTLANLVAAITASAGSGTTYGSDTVANTDATATTLPDSQIQATALTAGSAGNAIATTETTADGAWLHGATLSGGQDIPTYSEFFFDRLATDATILRAVSLVHRGFKGSAGTAKIKVSLVDVSDNVALGTERTLTTTPTWREEVIDTDPTTSGGLTPLMLLGARVRVDRTE
jgi:hypothetical protein